MPSASTDYAARVARVLKATQLIDGHNDWPEVLRERENDARWTVNLNDLSGSNDRYNTDVSRLRKGLVGRQFLSGWVCADLPGKQQVEQTLEQIDLVHSIAARYPQVSTIARTADDVMPAHMVSRIASMIGVDDGGQIDGNLSVWRTYGALGAG